MQKPVFLVLIALIGSIALPQLTGCESLPALRESKAWHGQTPIYATYRFGLLKAEIPPGVSLETVNAATKAVLHRQGHIIEEASFTPADGRIVALGSSQMPNDQVKVITKYDGGGVIMTININPTTESRSRALFESILQALGL